MGFPGGIAKMILQYYQQWQWDAETRTNHRLEVSPNGQLVGSPICRSNLCVYSSIFLDRWLTEEGRYYFEFKFHGELHPHHNELSIGIVSHKYDLSNRHGVGSDKH